MSDSAVPWTTAHHTSLSFPITWNLLNSYSFGASQVMLAVKNLLANAGDMKCRFGPGRSLGEGNGNPLQGSCLENAVDKAWGLQSRQSCLTLCNLAHRHMSIASVILPNHPILCHPLLFISNGPMVKSLLSGAHKMTLPSVAWAEVCTQEIDLFATELSLRC